MSAGRRGLMAAVVVGIVVSAGVGFVVADPFGAEAKGTPAQSAAPTGLAQVTKGALSARTLENGTLGYAGDYQVVNKASGTVTKLPAVGQVVVQGRTLYRVDGKPVVLLYGAVPIYRDLSWGMEGADVRQLNAALVALGHAAKDEIDPDSTYFGRQTYYAVKELQEAAGLSETGTLTLGHVVFVPAKKIRVTKVIAVHGGMTTAGSVVVRTSSTRREVSVMLNAGQQSQVAVGDRVTISLPTGKSTPGVVSSVGKVATKADNSTTIDVRIRPLRPKATGRLDQAPVQVSIVSDTVKDVLAVPVNALLALAGGGYAVEVVEPGGEHRLIPIKTGLFDDSAGKVEVSGNGLAAGQNIVVPAT
ncbi:peptidoglycan-binding protein [Nonomuraea africana]|uniref:Peptidoglycan hydrolase-like protein with peptidoglycan-binding domain n=1 Tax=Nonomuraea africana TaxID=46171 RepID=A0ABR9KW64_9ACTN|nr:peptidoglycan-binding protein [Nonomuraea africana]MBE1565873.1 peptidoglycan hydrolase-like protein with peptidoglycan-binding domain [Nonomuraea africana]